MTLLHPIQHKTDRSHYERYRDLAKQAGVTLVNTRDFLGRSHVACNQALAGEVGCRKCWRCMYLLDNALNSVPLREWDIQLMGLWRYQGRVYVKTLSEGVCMYKHLVIYEILGAEPVF